MNPSREADAPTQATAVALSTAEVFVPEPPVAVLGGGIGSPSYDAVLAEHQPLAPGGDSCRACGFVYTDRRVCPAVILAVAGCPVLADREYGALCELSVAMQRMGSRLDAIGARVVANSTDGRSQDRVRGLLRRWSRIVGGRG